MGKITKNPSKDIPQGQEIAIKLDVDEATVSRVLEKLQSSILGKMQPPDPPWQFDKEVMSV